MVKETKKSEKKNTDRLSDDKVSQERQGVGDTGGAGKERGGKRRNAVLVLLSVKEWIRKEERQAKRISFVLVLI